MNFKGFKKVSEDEKKAVLKNANGHSITLAKKGLTKEHLEGLARLPIHAAAGLDTEPAAESTKVELTPLQKEYNKEVMATTNERKYMFGERGEAPGHVDSDALKRAQATVSGMEKRAASANQNKALREEEQAKSREALGIASPAPRPAEVEVEQPIEEPAPQASGMEAQPAQSAQPTQPASSPNQAQMPGVGSPGMQDRMASRSGGFGEPISTAKPIAATPEEHSAIYQQEANQEANNIWNDLLQGHIKAKTYSDLYADKSTLGKIGTIFGLLLSGAGSGLAHQPNALLEMMNKEIERDLEAQKEASGKIQNMVKLNIDNELAKAKITREQAETLGVWKDIEGKAINNARNTMLLTSTHHLMQQTGLLPEGPMKQQAMQSIGGVKQAADSQIMKNNAELGHQLANDPEGEYQKKQAALRSAGALGIVPGAENLASQNEARHIPGFGHFTQALPQEVKSDLTAKMEYEKAARRYVEFAKKHSMNWANLKPFERQKIINEGAVLGAELQGKYRIKTKGGVYKEGEQEFINKIIPENATSWKAAFSQIPRVEQTIENNFHDTDNLAKSYGGAAPRYNPNDGKYYVRGQNGEAIEVK